MKYQTEIPIIMRKYCQSFTIIWNAENELIIEQETQQWNISNQDNIMAILCNVWNAASKLIVMQETQKWNIYSNNNPN